MHDAWSQRMKRTWDQLAERDAMHYIATDCLNWDRSDFLMSGERIVARLAGLTMAWPPQQPSGTALDLGCGIGRLSFALARGFTRVIGVDVSEAMIRRARALAAELRVPNVEFIQSNGCDLRSVPDVNCEFVLSYVVLQHFPTDRLVLNMIAELGRVLRPAGRAVFHVPVYREGFGLPAWRMAQWLFRVGLRPAEELGLVNPERGTAFRGSRLAAGDLRRALARAGLRLDQVEREPSRYRFCDEWIVVCTKQ